MARQDFVNKDFEYFNVEINPVEGGSHIVDLREDTVAIIKHGGAAVQFNQLDVFAKSEFDYDSIILDKQTIIDLAEYLKNL